MLFHVNSETKNRKNKKYWQFGVDEFKPCHVASEVKEISIRHGLPLGHIHNQLHKTKYRSCEESKSKQL